MHFRERNQIVQIIRTKYDAVSKKGKNEIVGRLVKANPQLTDELTAALTKDEGKKSRHGSRATPHSGVSNENLRFVRYRNNWSLLKNGLPIKQAMRAAFWLRR